jgi:taurine dioxygenase
MAIQVIPTGAALGAEIRGVDISKPLSAKDRDAIRAAWLKNLILLFRDQSLDDPALMAFARNFGALEHAPSNENSAKFGGDHEAYPEIAIISNIVENGRAVGSLGAGEAAWHSDSSFIETPPAGSFLYAIEIPPEGGNTYFCNMYRAYETLSADLKRKIEGRRAVHSFAYTSAGQLRKGFDEVSDVTKSPGARHPLVRTHPETGRKALYPGRRLGSYVVGLPVEESEALLDALWAHATQDAFVWGHRWRVGDLIVWDNRCALHRRDPFDPKSRRLLHRTQTKGDVPYEQLAELHALP